MSTSATETKSDKKNNIRIPIPVAILVVIALIAFAVFMGYKTFNQNDMADRGEFLSKVAKLAGPNADLSKLSPADRERFNREVPSHQPEILKMWIANHKQ